MLPCTARGLLLKERICLKEPILSIQTRSSLTIGANNFIKKFAGTVLQSGPFFVEIVHMLFELLAKECAGSAD